MYALPFFVLRAFGEPADLIVCLASGSMLELLINAIPLPGGTGGAEVGFAYLFRDMFGQHLAAGFGRSGVPSSTCCPSSSPRPAWACAPTAA